MRLRRGQLRPSQPRGWCKLTATTMLPRPYLEQCGQGVRQARDRRQHGRLHYTLRAGWGGGWCVSQHRHRAGQGSFVAHKVVLAWARAPCVQAAAACGAEAHAFTLPLPPHGRSSRPYPRLGQLVRLGVALQQELLLLGDEPPAAQNLCLLDGRSHLCAAGLRHAAARCSLCVAAQLRGFWSPCAAVSHGWAGPPSPGRRRCCLLGLPGALQADCGRAVLDGRSLSARPGRVWRT